MTEDEAMKIESWFKNWEVDHGIPKNIDDLHEVAFRLCIDIPIGFEASRHLAFWIFNVYNAMKSSTEVKGGENNADICDSVNHPAHYTSGDIECIDAIENSMSHVEFEGYLKGSVFKYLWRYRNKNALIKDLKKAQWYLNKLIGHFSKKVKS